MVKEFKMFKDAEYSAPEIDVVDTEMMSPLAASGVGEDPEDGGEDDVQQLLNYILHTMNR